MEIQVSIQLCLPFPWDKEEREQGEMSSLKVPLLPNIKLLVEEEAQNYQYILDEQVFKFLLTIPFAKEQRIPKANSPKRGPPTMPKMLSAAWGRKKVCYQVLCKESKASKMTRREDVQKEIMKLFKVVCTQLPGFDIWMLKTQAEPWILKTWAMGGSTSVPKKE